MLQRLQIHNIALIENLEIDFHAGLNILTGETGAGKSIILGAIALILGDKIDPQMLRTGAQKGWAEACFDVSTYPSLLLLLDEKGISWEDEDDLPPPAESNSNITPEEDANTPIPERLLIIKRTLNQDGRTKAFINQQSVTVSTLKEISLFLVDISSQRDHQILLKVPEHIRYLDCFANLTEEVAEFSRLYSQFHQQQKAYTDLVDAKHEKEKQLEFLHFAMDEISKVDPQIDEEDTLNEELKFLSNYQQIITALSSAYDLLYENEYAVLTQLGTVQHGLMEISALDKQVEEYLSEMAEAIVKLENVKDGIRSQRDNVEFSPERLEEINVRLDMFQHLKKKYGGSIEQVLAYKDHCQEQIDQLGDDEIQLAGLWAALEKSKKEMREAALNLSSKRQRAAKALNNAMKEELQFLGMEKARFKVEFRYLRDPESFIKINDDPVQYFEDGIDKVEYTFSANPGESLKPLSKIASGGELARVTLSLKNILSTEDDVSCMIFDESDEGVGGETVFKFARKLKEISHKKQVLCITHSPQIASKADYHYFVEKMEKQGRTISTITPLNDQTQVREIARLLAGDNPSETSLNHAKELLLNKDR